jgi:hypothetical protein
MNWLLRLKIGSAESDHPTKPTKQGSAGFVGTHIGPTRKLLGGTATSGSVSSIPATAAKEEVAILAWLDAIDESDPATIAHVLQQCRNDPDARAFYLSEAMRDP